MKKIALLTLFLTIFTKVYSQISADIETGIVKVNRNDASSSWKNSFGDLNGIDGTLFSYAKDFNNPVKPLFRVRASYAFGKSKKHFLSFLAAPVQYKTVGILNNPITFNSIVFSANQQTEGFYKFNGYRLTYRYYFVQRNTLTMGLGLTLNLRDAEFSLRQGTKYERNYNRGLVPLINTYLNYKFTDHLGVLVDGDVFYVDNTGGAIDYLTGFNYSFNKNVAVKTGYRFFSGVGSEKGNVYNKLFVSTFVIGGVLNFN
jgi:hypothetical protein